jgi:hypothetical protein
MRALAAGETRALVPCGLCRISLGFLLRVLDGWMHVGIVSLL